MSEVKTTERPSDFVSTNATSPTDPVTAPTSANSRLRQHDTIPTTAIAWRTQLTTSETAANDGVLCWTPTSLHSPRSQALLLLESGLWPSETKRTRAALAPVREAANNIGTDIDSRYRPASFSREEIPVSFFLMTALDEFLDDELIASTSRR